MKTVDELKQGMQQAVFDAGVEKAWPHFNAMIDFVQMLEGVSQQQLCLLCAMKIITLMGECDDDEIFEYFLGQLLKAIDEGSRKCREEQ
jgi:hypothetical protein